jgi:hypothetical protein
MVQNRALDILSNERSSRHCSLRFALAVNIGVGGPVRGVATSLVQRVSYRPGQRLQ